MNDESIFLNAFMSGLGASVMLYSPPGPYRLYRSGPDVSHAFGKVGQYLTYVSAPAIYAGQEERADIATAGA